VDFVHIHIILINMAQLIATRSVGKALNQ